MEFKDFKIGEVIHLKLTDKNRVSETLILSPKNEENNVVYIKWNGEKSQVKYTLISGGNKISDFFRDDINIPMQYFTSIIFDIPEHVKMADLSITR